MSEISGKKLRGRTIPDIFYESGKDFRYEVELNREN